MALTRESCANSSTSPASCSPRSATVQDRGGHAHRNLLGTEVRGDRSCQVGAVLRQVHLRPCGPWIPSSRRPCLVGVPPARWSRLLRPRPLKQPEVPLVEVGETCSSSQRPPCRRPALAFRRDCTKAAMRSWTWFRAQCPHFDERSFNDARRASSFARHSDSK